MFSKNRPPRLLTWLIPLAVMAGIFCLSTGAFSADHTVEFFGPYNFVVRKAAHVTEYAVLFLVLRWVLSKLMPRCNSLLVALIAVALAAGYACTDEFHQMFVPGRGPSFIDVCIDTAGAILGAALWAAATMVRRLRRRN